MGEISITDARTDFKSDAKKVLRSFSLKASAFSQLVMITNVLGSKHTDVIHCQAEDILQKAKTHLASLGDMLKAVDGWTEASFTEHYDSGKSLVASLKTIGNTCSIENKSLRKVRLLGVRITLCQ